MIQLMRVTFTLSQKCKENTYYLFLNVWKSSLFKHNRKKIHQLIPTQPLLSPSFAHEFSMLTMSTLYLLLHFYLDSPPFHHTRQSILTNVTDNLQVSNEYFFSFICLLDFLPTLKILKHSLPFVSAIFSPGILLAYL